MYYKSFRHNPPAALVDTSAEQTDTYRYAVTGGGGGVLYYQYNDYQRSVQTGFLTTAE